MQEPATEKTRRVVQIAFTSFGETEMYIAEWTLAALCDDGSMWCLNLEWRRLDECRWQRLPEIPGT